MSGLRDYQSRAVEDVRTHWASGVRAVCLVAPTGAGKTRMGEELIADCGPVVWVAHRRELIQQTAKRLASRFGSTAVGVIMPGEYARPRARVQVSTVQTLLARATRPPAERLVLDEGHHYAAEDWRALAESYGTVPTLGLTATPERQDGKPLGDIFERLVVSASYSELIAGGYLVPARVHRPDAMLGNDLAQDPVTAWRLYSEGSRAFVFCGRVADAYAWAQKFRDVGVVAAVIEAGTAKGERDDALARFSAGKVRVIVNVNTMTEGVDVPDARTVILARAFGHVGGYLQAVGRALRPAKGKPDMILIDLTGTSRRHGLPTDDRVYSLDGRAISATGPEHGGGGVAEWSQEIRGVELRLVARGALPADMAAAPVDLARVDVERRAYKASQHLSHPAFARMRDIELRGTKQ